MKQFIYKITSPTGKVYVGCTNNFKRRFARYRCMDCKNQPMVYDSFIEHGVQNHIFEIIQECEFFDKEERESFWGMTFDVLGDMGLNCSLPKSKHGYPRLRNELIDKLKILGIGRIPPNRKGSVTSEKTLEKMRLYMGKERYNSIAVINIETGILFESIAQAAKAHNMPTSRIHENLFITLKNRTQFVLAYP